LGRRALALLAQDRQRAGDVTPRLAEPRRILGDAHRELEAEVEDLLGQLADLLPDLVLAQIPPLRRFHRSPLTAPARGSRTSSGSPSSGRRSETLPGPSPRSRLPSRRGCGPASPRPPIPRDCPSPSPSASPPASSSPACRGRYGSRSSRRASDSA